MAADYLRHDCGWTWSGCPRFTADGPLDLIFLFLIDAEYLLSVKKLQKKVLPLSLLRDIIIKVTLNQDNRGSFVSASGG